jgi:hypothetical protein
MRNQNRLDSSTWMIHWLLGSDQREIWATFRVFLFVSKLQVPYHIRLSREQRVCTGVNLLCVVVVIALLGYCT